MRIPLVRDLSLSWRRPEFEKTKNARRKGLLVHISTGTVLSPGFRLRLPDFSRIATGTQSPLGALIRGAGDDPLSGAVLSWLEAG